MKSSTYKSLFDYYKDDIKNSYKFLGYKTGWSDFD